MAFFFLVSGLRFGGAVLFWLAAMAVLAMFLVRVGFFACVGVRRFVGVRVRFSLGAERQQARLQGQTAQAND